ATSIRLDDGRIFDVENITLADSSLFDVLPTPILEGNPKEILAIEDHAMIPRSLADKIGGEVIGLKISDVSLGDSYKATIGGVYEDYPLNSTIRNSIYLGLHTIGKFMYDGSDNLMGNDRYNSYVRLAKGADAVELQPVIQAHVNKVAADLMDNLALGDYRLWLRPLTESYTSQPGVRIMSRMLGILAVVLLMCAGLNYLLITIGQLGHRAKEMAIRKCYGTPHHRLFSRIMGESLFFLVVSLGLAVLVAFSFSGLCKDLLDYTPGQLFSTGRVWVVEIAVCLGLLIITGVVPSVLYSRTPVGRLFHPAAGRSKIWKLTLLALQFFATGLIMCLLVLT
ncbi:MAG: hypothetical protein K2G69_03665, partial [Muribaculaceae bacterium]|nr:hypothetical protein [Muribaculaceae bacterium]